MCCCKRLVHALTHMWAAGYRRGRAEKNEGDALVPARPAQPP